MCLLNRALMAINLIKKKKKKVDAYPQGNTWPLSPLSHCQVKIWSRRCGRKKKAHKGETARCRKSQSVEQHFAKLKFPTILNSCDDDDDADGEY